MCKDTIQNVFEAQVRSVKPNDEFRDKYSKTIVLDVFNNGTKPEGFHFYTKPMNGPKADQLKSLKQICYFLICPEPVNGKYYDFNIMYGRHCKVKLTLNIKKNCLEIEPCGFSEQELFRGCSKL